MEVSDWAPTPALSVPGSGKAIGVNPGKLPGFLRQLLSRYLPGLFPAVFGPGNAARAVAYNFDLVRCTPVSDA